MTLGRPFVERLNAQDAPIQTDFTKLFRVIHRLTAIVGHNLAHNADQPPPVNNHHLVDRTIS